MDTTDYRLTLNRCRVTLQYRRNTETDPFLSLIMSHEIDRLEQMVRLLLSYERAVLEAERREPRAETT